MVPSPLDRILELVERGGGRRTPGRDNFLVSCPVPGHGKGRGDRMPSLSVAHVNGHVLLNCQAGCHTQDVLLAWGLDWTDLFDQPITSDRGTKVAEWTYHRPDGTPYMVVERYQTSRGKSFKQHMPDGSRFPHGFQPCLYHIPQLFAAIKRGEEVWIVEGEKCVHAIESLGVVATTNPGGAGKWRDYMTGWFEGCVGVNIVTDNDEVGREHATTIAVHLRGIGVPVRTWQVALDAPKADVYDHVAAGYGIADLRPVRLNRLRPEGTSAACLLTTEYPPITWAIDGLLPTGLALLGGPPKTAKSMCALDMALGVAHGGRAMSELVCRQGSVLYLSLDNDSERRLAARAKYLLDEAVNPDLPIEFHCDWPTGDAAIAACQEWVDDEHDQRRRPLLVVVDTLGKVEPNFEGGQYDNAYLASTANLSRWSKFATDNDVAVLAVHHDRKCGDEDWLNRFTGSRGLTATAQTLMMLEVKRGEPTGWLRVVGRDIESDDLELTRVGWAWVTHDSPSSGLRVIEGGRT